MNTPEDEAGEFASEVGNDLGMFSLIFILVLFLFILLIGRAIL